MKKDTCELGYKWENLKGIYRHNERRNKNYYEKNYKTLYKIIF